MQTARDHELVSQFLPQTSRDDRSALIIDRMLVCAGEHRTHSLTLNLIVPPRECRRSIWAVPSDPKPLRSAASSDVMNSRLVDLDASAVHRKQ